MFGGVECIAALADVERVLADASTEAFRAGDVLVGDALRVAWVRTHEVIEALLVREVTT